MVYVDPDELKWFPYVKSWLVRQENLSEATKTRLTNLFQKHVAAAVNFTDENCVVSIKQVGSYGPGDITVAMLT